VARARGWEGTVDVGLAVRADGGVDAARVRRSSGYGLLDRAAVEAARRSRFQPAPTAEPVRGFIEYRFQLAGNDRR
jgi:protein TonB